MTDRPDPQDADTDHELARATREILSKWLSFELMTLWDAALIANGASPDAGGLGLGRTAEAAVVDTHKALQRSAKLKAIRGQGEEALYDTASIFKALQAQGHRFPALVSEALIKQGLIQPGKGSRKKRHGNAERFENDRIQVMEAMIRVLADPELQLTCRRNADAEGPVVGIELARTIVRNQKNLFQNGKAPRKPESIAKLFRQIVPPQID